VSSARALVAALVICVVAVAVALGAGWSTEDDEFDRRGARAFAQAALEDAGLTEVEVADDVEATDYRPRTFAPDDPPLQVYRTNASTEGGTVELLVHGPSGRAVYLRDVATDGGPLLSDQQYRRLRAFAWSEEADRAERRRLVGSAAAAVLVLVAFATVITVRREKMGP
jgi:hypothetical protein